MHESKKAEMEKEKKWEEMWKEPGGWPLSRLPQPPWITAICHSCCLALTATLIDNEPRAL